MTRNRMYTLTGISVGLFVFLTWAFADGLFNTNWWDSSVAPIRLSSPMRSWVDRSDGCLPGAASFRRTAWQSIVVQ